MKCGRCRSESPPGSKFCLECGGSFAARCGRCDTELPVTAKFCNECGQPVARPAAPKSERAPSAYTPKHLAEKILTSRSALEGERKQVTVLFADVKGSMELAEHVDPEEWHKILDKFFQILTDGVHRFEGTVNQYTGDGIMALFGAPVALEDHARRACYAALHIRDALRRYADELSLERGLNFSVRIGLNSGEVVVGKIGDDLRMDYTAQGRTVGLAARMEQIAEPGKALLTEHTAKLAAGFFDLRDLGASKIKGLPTTLHVYELAAAGRARTHIEVARGRGLSKFVGREDGIKTLEAALARCRDGNGQVVGVVAEAGIGKSRLCYEFVESCRRCGLTVLEGHAVAHGKNVPFLPILQVFRAYFGISEQDDDRTVREKIAGRLLLIDEVFRQVLPLIFEFFGVADPRQAATRIDPEARQRQLFGVLRRVVREGGQADPAVTLIEDLQWMDGGSGAFLKQWVDAIGGARGLLLVNFRPEYHADWMQKSYYHQLPLAPLGPGATRELVTHLLGQDPSTSRLAETIHTCTVGNPFFTEELVQSLIESGHLEGARGSYRLVSDIAALKVPARVEAVLASRVDRLPEREKHVLQTAAVIGKRFAEDVLEAAVDLPATDLAGSLQILAGAEFLYERLLYPVAEYEFKHPLTQEVAYHSQLGARRARVHAAVARAIETLNADRLDERSALLAYHWESAGDVLGAARWHARAAQWVGLSDLAETARHWRQVRSLLQQAPESAETRALSVAACLGLLGMGGFRMGMPEDEVETVFTEGRDLARQSGDLPSECMIVAAHASVRGGAGDMSQYVDGSLEAARLAERCGDRGVVLAVAVPLVYSHYSAGRLNEAWGFVSRILEAPPEDPRLGRTITGLCPYAWMETVGRSIAVFMGALDSGRAVQTKGIEIARRLGDLDSLGWGCTWAAYLAEFTGEREGWLERCREGFEIADRTGGAYERAYASARLGVAHLVRKEWAEAVELLEAALEIARRHRVGLEAEAHWLSYLAMAHLGLGRLRAAHEAAERAISIAQQRGTRAFEIAARLARARVLGRSEGKRAKSEIQEALSRARSLIEETGARAYEPFVHEERAELARLLGDEAGRQRDLREAHRLYTEMGATGHAERLAKELGL